MEIKENLEIICLSKIKRAKKPQNLKEIPFSSSFHLKNSFLFSKQVLRDKGSKKKKETSKI